LILDLGAAFSMPVCVVKLGGSLLDMPDLALRLRAWIAAQSPCDTILVVGGGKLADAIRQAQIQHGFSDSVAHWLCVRTMAIQAEMLLAMLPEVRLLTGIAAVGGGASRLWILDAWHFMREDDRRHTLAPLPESWDVTSDSIAARAAELCCADELVLLKSAPADELSLAELAESGYVDGYFPQAARTLKRVRFVDLRGG
jgi:5-(aminomethyl)-3-furanmethanol phosphate kinase